MIYSVDSTTAFVKDVKRAKRQGLDISKLNEVIGALALGQRLPANKHDHALKGEYRGCRECHISPDWLLVYKRNDVELVLLLVRTGTHRDLGVGK